MKNPVKKRPRSLEEKVAKIVENHEKRTGESVTWLSYTKRQIGFVKQSPTINYSTL